MSDEELELLGKLFSQNERLIDLLEHIQSYASWINEKLGNIEANVEVIKEIM